MVFILASSGLLALEALIFLSLPLLDRFTYANQNLFVGPSYDAYKQMTEQEHLQLRAHMRHIGRIWAGVLMGMAAALLLISLAAPARAYFEGLSAEMLTVIIMALILVPLICFIFLFLCATTGLVRSKRPGAQGPARIDQNQDGGGD